MLFCCARNGLLSLLILSTFISISYALPYGGFRLNSTSQTHEHPTIGSPVFWWKLGISLCLILSGGVFAGLTLGLMGLDELHLRVLATSSDDLLEKRNAQKGAYYHIPFFHLRHPRPMSFLPSVKAHGQG